MHPIWRERDKATDSNRDKRLVITVSSESAKERLLPSVFFTFSPFQMQMFPFHSDVGTTETYKYVGW